MRKWLWALLAVALFMTLGAKPDKSYWVERFDVSAGVLQGGDLRVDEQVVFHFQGGPFTYVFRELPPRATDGIVDIVASADGRTLPEGDGPGQVEVEYGEPIRVTWHMEPTSDTARTFDLSYRIRGVMRQEQNVDLLWWRPLPAEHAYTIAASEITITYPSEWPLAAQPSLEQGRATITTEPGLVRVGAADLGPNQSLAIQLPFQPGSALAGPPAWQAREQGAARQAAERRSQQNDRAWA
jgi:hypothetical protein